jgi:hypothetical protein
MYIDLASFGGNSSDANRFIGAADANTQTGIFSEFGFNQILATSIYDFSDFSVFGSFYDTNVPSSLAFANVPASGTALDGATTVDLVTPDCANGQCDIDGLSPLVPPLGTDNEGFLQTWDLQVEFTFFGTLTAGGPVYTSGTIDVFFNDLFLGDGDQSGLALTASLTGSTLQAANLDLFFDITFAAEDFLFIDTGSGFVDANDVIDGGSFPRLALDTNVNPPIPTTDQLLLVVDDGGNPNVIRQATLDGSVTASVPEPTSLALLGAALLGAGATSRRRSR